MFLRAWNSMNSQQQKKKKMLHVEQIKSLNKNQQYVYLQAPKKSQHKYIPISTFVCYLVTWTTHNRILNPEVTLKFSHELSTQDREVLRPPWATVDGFHIVFIIKVT